MVRGAGYVYKCQDANGNIFAIKLLNPQNVTTDKQKRFKNEVLFCQQTNHSNVLKVLDDGPHLTGDKSVSFYVMPYYDFSLCDLLKKGIKTDHVLQLFPQMLDGVEVAHLKKTVHRDLKPENFLYSTTENRIVVTDFGIALFQEEEPYTAVKTKAENRLANFQYAAPEQRRRGDEVDARADIYALDLIFNEMFTGKIPQGTGYKTIESVTREYTYLDDLVSTMLRQNPSERPSSIDGIKRVLIGRKNEFIELQRISNLKRTVIPESEIDDSLITDPIHLADFDWQNELLTLKLSRQVNDLWVWAFQNLGNYQSLSGKPHHRLKLGNRMRKYEQKKTKPRLLLISLNHSYLAQIENMKKKQKS